MGLRLPTPAELENQRKSLENEERRRVERENAQNPNASVKPELTIVVEDVPSKDYVGGNVEDVVSAQSGQDAPAQVPSAPPVVSNNKHAQYNNSAHHRKSKKR